jgi:hypothetical protein
VLQAAARQHQTPISDILKQYVTASGTVLDMTLPYEACPAPERRPHIADPGESAREVVTVAHVARDGLDHKVTLASGFVLNAMAPRVEGQDEEAMVLTCAHTLEEVRRLQGYVKNKGTNHCASWKVATVAATGASDEEPAYEAGIRLVRGCWRGHRTAGIPSFTRAVGASALGPAAALVPHATGVGARSSGVAVPCT